MELLEFLGEIPARVGASRGIDTHTDRSNGSINSAGGASRTKFGADVSHGKSSSVAARVATDKTEVLLSATLPLVRPSSEGVGRFKSVAVGSSDKVGGYLSLFDEFDVAVVASLGFDTDPDQHHGGNGRSVACTADGGRDSHPGDAPWTLVGGEEPWAPGGLVGSKIFKLRVGLQAPPIALEVPLAGVIREHFSTPRDLVEWSRQSLRSQFEAACKAQQFPQRSVWGPVECMDDLDRQTSAVLGPDFGIESIWRGEVACGPHGCIRGQCRKT